MSASARAPRVALYSRVSSEEQAERETIEAQRTFLKNYARLHSLNVVREFSEDAPGSLPLDKRSEGRRLLADAQARRFDIVVVHRVDRLGRTLQTILEAYETLATAGVAIKSATEPFDTSNPVGVFMFQLLGSLAQLDRATILELIQRKPLTSGNSTLKSDKGRVRT